MLLSQPRRPDRAARAPWRVRFVLCRSFHCERNRQPVRVAFELVETRWSRSRGKRLWRLRRDIVVSARA